MDGCLLILTRKCSNVEARETTEQDFYLRRRILIEKIELLCSLIETNAKLIPLEKEIIWNDKLCDLKKNIEKIKLEMTQSEISLRNENSDLNQFRRNVELNWETTKFAKKNIEESLKQKIIIQIAEFSSMLLVSNLKNKARKKSTETEIEWFNLRLKSLDEIYCSRMDALCNERYKMRKRYLDQFEKYDANVGSLRACKISLLLKKNCINERYIVIQDQLLIQRSLCERLKEEIELNTKKNFLANVEYFRRNHAAKIIQRNWKLYCARVPWKKRKGRKLTCS